LRNLDTGFNYENIVQFSVDVGSGYNLAQRVDLHKQLLARLEALPGARSATLSSLSLLSPMSMVFNVTLPGAAAGAADDVRCRKMVVGPRFFETLKMPLLMGRDFSAQDERPVPPPPPPGANAMPNAAAAPPLHVVINQAMARHYFGAENPLGKRLSEGRQELEVIGVVQGAKYGNLREAPQRTYYLYHLEQPTPRDVTFQLRTDSAASDYGATIQRLAKELDPRLQIVELRTMTDLADELLMQERFLAQTAGAFSLFALLLACVGLYGVMSYAVTRRTNEIGIRMALGAQPRNVVWLVMRQVLLLAGLGIGIGMTVALAATRYVTTWLYGLTPTDPLTLTLAALLMIGVVTLAGYLPARRATKVDPMIALRHE
jgi:predicted permease